MAKKKETASGRPTDMDAEVAYWLSEIKECKRREKEFRKEGDRILKIYDGTKAKDNPFNILYSNTETLLPALYSTTPRPVVERRFKDDDPVGRNASLASTRGLEFLMDTNLENYDPYDDVMKKVVLDGLLPGGGHARVKYEADIENLPDEEEESDDVQAEEKKNSPAPVVNYESVCVEHRQWNHVYIGYARSWNKVPYVIFEDHPDKAECVRLFGKSKAGKMVFTKETNKDEDEFSPREKEQDHQGERKTCTLYEVWDKLEKKVKFVSPSYKEGILKEIDDPLELSGFYPIPRPLTFVKKTHSLIPTALYTQYENQAHELNKIQVRINRIVEAMKARGVYDGNLGNDLEKLMEADDNALVPAENTSSLAAEKGLQNAIWFMPLDVLQVCLQRLYEARESCKQVIYEVTGISDILRGATKASETLGAQEIKKQFGTLRIDTMRKEVARYARDLLRLMLEVAAQRFSEETWAKMTGLPFATSQQVQQAQDIALAAQQSGQQPDQQTVATLNGPQWGNILQILKDDLSRAYRIDIETNSTVEPAATEDQQMLLALFTALGQLLNGVAPLVAKGVMPFPIVQSLMLFTARRFRFGSQIEGYLQAMQPPQPENQQDPKAMQQHMQQQMEVVKQKMEMDLESQKMAAEKDILQKKIDLELQEIQLKAEQEKFQLSQQMAEQKLAMRDQMHQAKVSADEKVRSEKEKSAKMADSHLKSTTGGLQQVAKQMGEVTKNSQPAVMSDLVTKMLQANQQLLQSMAQQEQRQTAMLQDLKAAMTAPRRKRAIRDASGRIAEVQEEVA